MRSDMPPTVAFHRCHRKFEGVTTVPEKLNMGVERQIEFFEVWKSTGVKDPELARFLGVDRSLVGHWRAGNREMPAEALLATLEHLDENDRARPETVCRHLVELAGRRANIQSPVATGDLSKEVADVTDAFHELLRDYVLDASDGQIDNPARKVALLDALIKQAQQAREAALRDAGAARVAK